MHDHFYGVFIRTCVARYLKPMKTELRNCLYCDTPFNSPMKEIRRGNGRFCSIACARKYRWQNTEKPVPNVICALCGIALYKSMSKQKKSKSGLFFCSRQCKDEGQKTIKEIQPAHYNTASGIHGYRALYLQHKQIDYCELCGYCKIPEILEVHHKDRNRRNNSITNLQLLCPTCHNEIHYLTNSGRFWHSKVLVETGEFESPTDAVQRHCSPG